MAEQLTTDQKKGMVNLLKKARDFALKSGYNASFQYVGPNTSPEFEYPSKVHFPYGLMIMSSIGLGYNEDAKLKIIDLESLKMEPLTKALFKETVGLYAQSRNTVCAPKKVKVTGKEYKVIYNGEQITKDWLLHAPDLQLEYLDFEEFDKYTITLTNKNMILRYIVAMGSYAKEAIGVSNYKYGDPAKSWYNNRKRERKVLS